MKAEAMSLKQHINEIDSRLNIMQQNLLQAGMALQLLQRNYPELLNHKAALAERNEQYKTAWRYFQQIIKPHKSPASSTRLIVNAVAESQPKIVVNYLYRLLQQYLQEKQQLVTTTQENLSRAKQRLRYQRVVGEAI